MAFWARCLVHPKGAWARQPVILDDWEEHDIVRPIFGEVVWSPEWKRYVRRYRIAGVVIARKNVKSMLASGIALLLEVADDEEYAEIYGAAKDTKQAGKVWEPAARMVELSPVLRKRLKVNRSSRRIVDEKTASYYEIITADALGELGHNPHGVVIDELLSQADGQLFEAMRTAGGTRTQPLILLITTETNQPESWAATTIDELERVQANPTRAPHIFAYVRKVPDDADPWDEANWALSNPALGSFLSVQTLREEALDARNDPRKESSFRQFRLNQRQSSAVRWLSSTLWARNGGLVVEEELVGRRCFAGLDLASTADFTAWLMLFPSHDGFEILPRFWLPRAAVDRRSPMRDTLLAWERAGFLNVTEGDVIDNDVIRKGIEADAERFVIEEFAYDRWNATETVLKLLDGGLVGWAMPQTTVAMNAPSKEVERLLGKTLLNHGGNPVLAWMAGNAMVRTDSEGNIKPDKKKSGEKIDGIVTLVMAVGASMRPREEEVEANVH